jgi:S1-C subfamily serine protease
VLVEPDGKATPVPRHALLVSDNPATATPRLIVTALDGTADVKLRPGNYTVESDRPVAFHGKAYQWTQTLNIVAGRDAVLELTAANADASTATTSASVETDPWVVLPQWQDSVVAVWTPFTRASGFVIDKKGLIATNQRAIGTATSVDVQLTPAIKVSAAVVAADAARDVAILWIDPNVVAAVRPVPLNCTGTVTPAIASGQEIFTIGVPLRQQKGITPGTVSVVEPRSLAADFRLARGSAGGPVFTADAAVIGITSLDTKDESRGADARVVRTADVCQIVASAEKKIENAAAPGGAHLPVEPLLPFPLDALKDGAQRGASSLSSHQISSSTFDATFITPTLMYGGREARARRAGRTGGTPSALAAERLLADFGDWSDYVDDYPPVLLVRVTPKLVESFWTTVARGAAQTQGVALPPIKHFTSGFLRMRVLCGESEVTPLHPFMLEQSITDSQTIAEGLYVFDPGAIGPQCGAVTLVLYSQKEPQKADTHVVDARVVQQIWDDFAPYRALNR